ncbi:MAG TPA: alpha/beta hydrolase-fold protein [Sphingobium sp.]|nr:alpha/beta hydrolase-fold protein [Sphingobium sp.]
MTGISNIHLPPDAGGSGPFVEGHFCLPGTASQLLRAPISGDLYRIDVAIPQGAPPADGWPSIVLLDATGSFGTCVEALRRMSRRPDATGVVPAVVIGIGAPDRVYDIARRRRDFTSGQEAGDTAGGAPAFLQFIEEQVKPQVAGEVSLDPRRQTLFGHSLAGYFALWVLGHHPHAFRNYAAISPSIWWDRAGLMGAVSAAPLRDRRALICLGEWEDSLPPWQRVAPGSAEVMARRRDRKMRDHAHVLTELLQSIHGAERVRFQFLPEEDHASIVSAAIPRMLRMASLE